MKLAALVPAYNSEAHLGDCLDSILAQGVEGLEVYVCDDGSTDRTAAILKEYAGRCGNVHFLSQANAGVCAALNALLDALPGDIGLFTIVDADDYLYPGALARLKEALLATGADVAEGGIAHVPNDSALPAEPNTRPTGAYTVLRDLSVYLLKRTAPSRNWINKNAKLYRRSAVGKLRFRVGLAFEEDYFYGCEVNAAIASKVIVPQVVYAYRDNPKSVTHVLDARRYFESTALRIRLTCEEFLNAGRIPSALEREYRADVSKDAYRMVIRKNLKRTKDAAERRELFRRAGAFLRALEREQGFVATGLNPIQRLIWAACRRDWYAPARILAFLT